MDRIHSDLSCSSCHKADEERRYRPLPKSCELCHSDIVRQQLAVNAGAINPHAGRVSCVQCHSPELKHQTPSVYANACRACHNQYYEGLFYDWMKSLNSQESQARMLLKYLRDQNAPDTEMLEQKIDHARRVGFHNLAYALELWGDILEDSSNDSMQNKTGSTATMKDQ